MTVEFKYQDLNFKERIGSGSSGDVYKGFIKESRGDGDTEVVIAIKKFKGVRPKVESLQWETERKYLANLRHPNIITLLGSCEDQPLKRSKEDVILGRKPPTIALFLIYEYMQKGSVSDKLRDLDWNQTKRIAMGSASAIKHLQDQTPPLAFRDFKPQNILLDEHYNPKLGDFGLVREEHQKLIAGTRGYTDPQTLKVGEGRKETDIYSMGVLLMQLITQEDKVLEDGKHIMVDIKRCYDSGKVKVGRKLVDTGCRETLARIVTGLALLCVMSDFASRPTIEEIIQKLGQLD